MTATNADYVVVSGLVNESERDMTFLDEYGVVVMDGDGFHCRFTLRTILDEIAADERAREAIARCISPPRKYVLPERTDIPNDYCDDSDLLDYHQPANAVQTQLTERRNTCEGEQPCT